MTDLVRAFVVRLVEEKARLPKGANVESFNYIDTIGLVKFAVEMEPEFDVAISEADMESPEFRTVVGWFR